MQVFLASLHNSLVPHRIVEHFYQKTAIDCRMVMRDCCALASQCKLVGGQLELLSHLKRSGHIPIAVEMNSNM